jgi:hypothetical protein
VLSEASFWAIQPGQADRATLIRAAHYAGSTQFTYFLRQSGIFLANFERFEHERIYLRVVSTVRKDGECL